jgi:hypothetical protein
LLMPFVLIVLGAVVLIDSHCFEERPLALISLGCLGAMSLSILRQIEGRDLLNSSILSIASCHDEPF